MSSLSARTASPASSTGSARGVWKTAAGVSRRRRLTEFEVTLQLAPGLLKLVQVWRWGLLQMQRSSAEPCQLLGGPAVSLAPHPAGLVPDEVLLPRAGLGQAWELILACWLLWAGSGAVAGLPDTLHLHRPLWLRPAACQAAGVMALHTGSCLRGHQAGSLDLEQRVRGSTGDTSVRCSLATCIRWLSCGMVAQCLGIWTSPQPVQAQHSLESGPRKFLRQSDRDASAQGAMQGALPAAGCHQAIPAATGPHSAQAACRARQDQLAVPCQAKGTLQTLDTRCRKVLTV